MEGRAPAKDDLSRSVPGNACHHGDRQANRIDRIASGHEKAFNRPKRVPMGPVTGATAGFCIRALCCPGAVLPKAAPTPMRRSCPLYEDRSDCAPSFSGRQGHTERDTMSSGA